MATLAQIEANRRNATRSTGPRSMEGKSVSRFNALKSGIYAESQLISGEDAVELEALAASYEDEFRPETGPEWFLVDSMLRADWRMRRFQKIEAELWEQGVREAGGLGQAYKLDVMLERVYRRMDGAERSFFRALKEMKELIEKEKKENEEEARELYGELVRRLAAEAPGPGTAEPAAEAKVATEASAVEVSPEAADQTGMPLCAPSQVEREQTVTEELGPIAPEMGDMAQQARITTPLSVRMDLGGVVGRDLAESRDEITFWG